MTALGPDEIWAKNKNSMVWFQFAIDAANQGGKEYYDFIHETYFKEKGTPTADDIKKQFELVSMQPGEPGDSIETVPGTPNKTDLLNDSKAMTTTEAIGEFLDNIFDNYVENYKELEKVRKNKDLSVRLLFNDMDMDEELRQNNGMLLITENSGGISREKWSPLIKMGYSQTSPDKESVGTWGRGSKLALASCGRWNQVQTHHISQPAKKNEEETSTIQISFGGAVPIDNPHDKLTKERSKKEHNYYHKLNSYWDIDAKASKSGWCVNEGPGTTCITIRRLTDKFIKEITDSEKYESMVKKLDEIFSCKINQLTQLGGGKIEVLLENATLPESDKYRNVYLSQLDETEIEFKGDINEYKKLFSYIPKFKPMHLKCSWESKEMINGKEVINELEAEIFLGSPLLNKEQNRGLHIWGNGRLFEKNMMENFEVPPSSGYSKVGGDGPQNKRVFGLIFLTSKKSFLIPWKGPVKWGWEENSEFSEPIMKLVGSLITRFTSLSHHLVNTNTAPGDGSNKLTDLYEYTEKVGISPDKFMIDCSTEEKMEQDLDTALAAITALTDSEVKQFISHHQGYSSNQIIGDNLGVSLKQTKQSLKEFIDVLDYRNKKVSELGGQKWYKDELLINAQSLALFLSPEAFLEYENEFDKYTVPNLKKWLKDKGIDFKSSGATKEYLTEKALESLQEGE